MTQTVEDFCTSIKQPKQYRDLERMRLVRLEDLCKFSVDTLRNEAKEFNKCHEQVANFVPVFITFSFATKVVARAKGEACTPVCHGGSSRSSGHARQSIGSGGTSCTAETKYAKHPDKYNAAAHEATLWTKVSQHKINGVTNAAGTQMQSPGKFYFEVGGKKCIKLNDPSAENNWKGSFCCLVPQCGTGKPHNNAAALSVANIIQHGVSGDHMKALEAARGAATAQPSTTKRKRTDGSHAGSEASASSCSTEEDDAAAEGEQEGGTATAEEGEQHGGRDERAQEEGTTGTAETLGEGTGNLEGDEQHGGRDEEAQEQGTTGTESDEDPPPRTDVFGSPGPGEPGHVKCLCGVPCGEAPFRNKVFYVCAANKCNFTQEVNDPEGVTASL